MKKIIFLFAFLFIGLLNFNFSGAKEKSCVRGGFLYEYEVQKEGTWVIKITPLSSEGISTLKIPEKLGGKNVVKLGGRGNLYFAGDTNTIEPNLNIFGVEESGENDGTLVPEDVQERVKKIKKIQLPSTLKSIGFTCFSHVQDGKIINIPKGIVQGLHEAYRSGFTEIKWKKITISSQNKKYKVDNGCLLSKDGKKLYGFVQKKKEINIPEGVETITLGVDYNGPSTIVIPKSVTKIKGAALTTEKPVTIKVSSKNTHYGVKKGSLYSKKSGRLVAGYINDGVLDIPDTVKRIYYPGVLGHSARLKKVVVPSSVKAFVFPFDFHDKRPLVYELKSTTPPDLLDIASDSLSWFEGCILYVPKNCKNAYLQKWQEALKNVECHMIEQG